MPRPKKVVGAPVESAPEECKAVEPEVSESDPIDTEANAPAAAPSSATPRKGAVPSRITRAVVEDLNGQVAREFTRAKHDTEYPGQFAHLAEEYAAKFNVPNPQDHTHPWLHRHAPKAWQEQVGTDKAGNPIMVNRHYYFQPEFKVVFLER